MNLPTASLSLPQIVGLVLILADDAVTTIHDCDS